MAEYAHPECLVTTGWVVEHSKDANVRVVEVDVDTKAYKEGHVPGAIAWDWTLQLCDTLRRALQGRQRGCGRVETGDRLLPHRRAIEP